MMGLGKHINHLHFINDIAIFLEEQKVTAECCRIAGDIDNLLWSQFGQQGGCFADPSPWRVKNNGIYLLSVFYKAYNTLRKSNNYN